MLESMYLYEFKTMVWGEEKAILVFAGEPGPSK